MINIQQLQTEREVLRLESINMAPLELINRLPIFVGNVSQFVKNIFTSEIKGALGYKPNTRVIARFNESGFANFNDLLVVKPVGLSTDYLSYIEALEKSDALVSTLLINALVPYKQWIGGMLNNPSNLSSMRDTKLTGDVRENERQRAAETLSKCFNMEKQNASEALGKLVPRAKDWDKITQSVVDLDKTLGVVNRESVDREISTISSLLTSLITFLESNKTSNAKIITANNMHTLSDITFAIAKECEYYAAHYYRIITLVNSVRSAEETVLKHVIAK